MLQIIPPDTTIDFIGARRTAVIVSLVLCGLSVLLVLVRGPKLGIDFAGGSLVHVRFASATAIEDVRTALAGAEIGAADIQDLGGHETEFLVRVPQSSEAASAVTERATSTLKERFGASAVDILRVETVGPRVGAVLREKAVLAVVFATLMMGIYIWLRFEWRFGLGAAVALIHDVIVTVGALIVFGYEFDLTIVAALLTIVGFSVNDTVVVSDRIRENRHKDRRTALGPLINRSINETLSRTVLTTGTSLLAVVTLYLLGGTVIHGFAFALIVGFVTGVYSTVYIAGPVVLYFEKQGASAPARSDGRAASAAAPRRT